MTAPLPPTSPEKEFARSVQGTVVGHWFVKLPDEPLFVYTGNQAETGAIRAAEKINSAHYAEMEALKERIAKMCDEEGDFQSKDDLDEHAYARQGSLKRMAKSIRSLDVRRG
jgi:hypothetical protein